MLGKRLFRPCHLACPLDLKQDWINNCFSLFFFVAVPTARDRPQMQGISDPYSLFMLLRVWSDPENVRDAALPLLMSREEEIRLALCLF